MKKAFDYDVSKNKRYELYLYVKSNLYDDSIAVQKGGEVVSFAWSFSPQNTGTLTQRATYQNMTIEKFVNEVVIQLNKER